MASLPAPRFALDVHAFLAEVKLMTSIDVNVVRLDRSPTRTPAGAVWTGETAKRGLKEESCQMGVEAVSTISTYFRVCDGVRVRFADNKADSGITVLLLAPWPESLWAFRRIWNRVAAVGRVVAIDLPGFGHSDGRPELIAPDSSGAFLARLIDEWGLGAPHVVGPDVGTAAALFLAAQGTGARHELDRWRRRGPLSD